MKAPLSVICNQFEVDINHIILQAKKFLKCNWLRQVAFKPNLKYLHIKTTPASMVTAQ